MIRQLYIIKFFENKQFFKNRVSQFIATDHTYSILYISETICIKTSNHKIELKK